MQKQASISDGWTMVSGVVNQLSSVSDRKECKKMGNVLIKLIGNEKREPI